MIAPGQQAEIRGQIEKPLRTKPFNSWVCANEIDKLQGIPPFCLTFFTVLIYMT